MFSPSVGATFWAPKAAVLLLVAAVGLPRLVGLLAGSARLPAVAALLFVGVSLASTVFSDAPLLSVLGLYNWGTGALFVASLAGAWSIGAALDEHGRRAVKTALLLAVGANVAAALAGLVLPVEELRLRPDGRSSGLLGNPVHLGAFLAAGLTLVGPWFRSRPLPGSLLVVGTAATLQLSGSRLSLVLGLLVALGPVLRWPLRLAGAFLALLLVGVVVGGMLAEPRGGASGSARLGAVEASTPTARLETWWSARRAAADAPVLGAGPGRFRAATSQYRTKKLALAEGSERVFTDAHNLLVEYVVTTGIVGFACLLAWLIVTIRLAAGPLLVFGLVLFVHHLLQPQWVGTTPLVFLALGAAMAGAVAGPGRTKMTGVATAVLAAVALPVAVRLLLGDFHLAQARLDFDLPHALKADAMLGHWPQPAQLVARITIVEPGPGRAAEARHWMEIAAGRDPTDPELWNDLADLEQRNGFTQQAERHYREALRHDPWSGRASAGLGRLRFAEARYAEAVPFLERAAELTRSSELLDLLSTARDRAS